MSIVVVATAFPKAGERDAVVAAFEKAIPIVHSEPGCEVYALHEGEDRVVMIEKWADQGAIAEHVNGEALRSLTAGLDGRLTKDLEIVVLAPHMAGTAQQGAL